MRTGDKVVTWNLGNFKAGDVVVFKHGSEVWVKRVKEIKDTNGQRPTTKDQRLIVEGDNKADSLEVEPLKRGQIIGKVIFKW